MNNRLIIAIVYMILVGFAFPIIRYMSLHFDVLNNNAVRLSSAAVVFILLAIWKFKAQVIRLFHEPKTLCYLFLIAIIMFFNIYLSTEGLKYTTALMGSIFGIIMMPVAIIISAIFFKDERAQLKSWYFYIGAIIAIIASFAFVLNNSEQGESIDLTKGVLFLTGWIIVQPIQNLIAKKITRQYHSIVVSASTATLGGLLYFSAATQTGVITQLADVSGFMFIALMLAGVYCLTAGMFFAFYIVEKQGLVFYNIIQLLVPVSTAIIGFLMLGEAINIEQTVAMLFVMLGCFIALKK
ncbi:DMT family transporter [Mannheimia sp. AT1]|uniref:DMT family transporter n=1 Tax=Mannheimia cairinae TaxID=3025936 RepID=A0ABT5MVQ0_9PAST|nr:DMT family transporter [Mannheimia cairinae]MDD0824948.1 DMT family transporter [Mannheimia cairinae]MDD0826122.1 DMT family transporter [Mannheimia cairinae]